MQIHKIGRFFIIFLMGVKIAFASESIKVLLSGDCELQSITGPITSLTPLSSGFSGDEVYLINDKFVLKRSSVQRTLFLDIQRQAAALGIAPTILYANPKEHFVLMKFLGKSPLSRDQYTIKHLAHLLRTIHGIIPIKETPSCNLDGILQNLCKVLKEEKVPQKVLDKLEKVLKFEKKASSKKTICHNDLNPNNLLFVKDKAVAIDWDAAGLNDPYYDLGTVAMWYINTPEVEKEFLELYLGYAPQKTELEYLEVMKKVAMAVIGGTLIKVGIKMGCAVKPETPKDSLPEFLKKIGMGVVKLDSGEKLYEFGLILLNGI